MKILNRMACRIARLAAPRSATALMMKEVEYCVARRAGLDGRELLALHDRLGLPELEDLRRSAKMREVSDFGGWADGMVKGMASGEEADAAALVEEWRGMSEAERAKAYYRREKEFHDRCMERPEGAPGLLLSRAKGRSRNWAGRNGCRIN